MITLKHFAAILMLALPAACAIEDDSLPEDTSLEESEGIDDVGADTEAYRKPIKLPVTSCTYYRTEDTCGGGGCFYWYLDVNSDQQSCGDRICQCETT